MLEPSYIKPLGRGAFGIFAVIAGLTLLTSASYVAPGCTGPEVQRCDYVSTAKAAVNRSPYHHPFAPDRSYEIFDQGSSVLIQQRDLCEGDCLSHASSALIDKKSCRVCAVSYFHPEPISKLDVRRGPLIMRVAAEDPAGEVRELARMRALRAEALAKYSSTPGS